MPGPLEIFPMPFWKFVLFILSDPFHSPVGLSYYMVFVCNNGCLGKTDPCYLPKVWIHVTNEVFYILFGVELREILHQIVLITIRENIQNLPSEGVCNDTVVLLPTGITLKFIQRNHFRKCCGFVVVVLKIPHSRHT